MSSKAVLPTLTLRAAMTDAPPSMLTWPSICQSAQPRLAVPLASCTLAPAGTAQPAWARLLVNASKGTRVRCLDGMA
ncbi:hypothetical protein [Melaminivora jejuensis]